MNTPQSISPRWSLRALCALGLVPRLACRLGKQRKRIPVPGPGRARRRARRQLVPGQPGRKRQPRHRLGHDRPRRRRGECRRRQHLARRPQRPGLLPGRMANGRARRGRHRRGARASSPASPAGSSPRASRPRATRPGATWSPASPNCSTAPRSAKRGCSTTTSSACLALHQAGAPQPILRQIVDYLRTQQHADGGWTWNASPSAPADTDMTGSVVAAFCAAGVGVGDPDLQQAFALLHSLQDPATGGFIAPPESFGIGVNTDTTSWVTSGLIQCGIDPQGPEWTTSQGKTPLDYLVSLQRPDGHFDWTDEFAGGAFETYDSVRPLGGIGFSTAPPARLDGVSPAVRAGRGGRQRHDRPDHAGDRPRPGRRRRADVQGRHRVGLRPRARCSATPKPPLPRPAASMTSRSRRSGAAFASPRSTAWPRQPNTAGASASTEGRCRRKRPSRSGSATSSSSSSRRRSQTRRGAAGERACR